MIAAPPEGVRRPRTVLAATLSVQAAATLALTAPAVMAPVVAPLLELPPQRIGWFVGLAYAAAMASGLAVGPRVARAGTIRLSRVAMACCAVGLLCAAAAAVPGGWPLLLVGALAIGIGYGLPNPSAALLLTRHAPPARLALYFSIKQTGVPVGVGLAGLVVPPLLAAMAWPVALVAIATGCVALGLGLARLRPLDVQPPDRPAANAAAGAGPFAALVAPLARVLRSPPLRRLGLASLAFSMTQLCFVTFLVSYLALELGRGLALAAGVLSLSQVVSVACRVGWGAVADRWIPPMPLLGVLGVAMAASVAGLGTLPAAAAPVWLLVAALACAATCMAWNGVFMAALAAQVRADDVATITGATQVLTFCGAMLGPVLFALLVGPLGGLGPAYRWLAVLPLAAGCWLWSARGRVSPA